jgi:hypothetical protein
VTVLSDSADGPRSLGEAASVGPTHHVLDWFHLSMRIQHMAQAVKPSFRLAVTTKRRKSWKNCPGSSKNVAM